MFCHLYRQEPRAQREAPAFFRRGKVDCDDLQLVGLIPEVELGADPHFKGLVVHFGTPGNVGDGHAAHAEEDALVMAGAAGRLAGDNTMR